MLLCIFADLERIPMMMCLGSMFMTQTILLAIEVLQIQSTSLKEHFRDGWNTIDMANIILVYAFIITNIAQLDQPTD